MACTLIFNVCVVPCCRRCLIYTIRRWKSTTISSVVSHKLLGWMPVLHRRLAKYYRLLTYLVLLNRRGVGAEVEDFFDMDWDYEAEVCTRLFYTSRLMMDSFRRHGQFISLDATCKTNRFNMPLVLLVGTTNTFETTIFCMAFIQVEDIDSYTWVLNNFKRAVGTHNTHIVHISSTLGIIVVDSWSCNGDYMVYLWYTKTSNLCTMDIPCIQHIYTK